MYKMRKTNNQTSKQKSKQKTSRFSRTFGRLVEWRADPGQRFVAVTQHATLAKVNHLRHVLRNLMRD
jgi:hypothetical protein